MTLTASLPIPVRRVTHSRIEETDFDNLDFGKYMTDHMLICDYSGGRWQSPQILPFSDFSLSPTTLAFHYGQTIFEGMKAFRMEDGRISIFRLKKHYDRLVRSSERLCIPVVPEAVFMEGLRQLVELDRDWVPVKEGSSLYIRPFIIATGDILRVAVSDKYRFAIICSPSGAYYSQPMSLKVERDFARAAKGGTGYAKCGGNYGGSFYPTQKAREEGYDQVLWTDGRENKYVEESGAMNVFFVMGNTLVTPPLSDSILDGVTRSSLITLATDAGIKVQERPVSVDELKEQLEKGKITEAFGAGTAAVISPIRTIGIDGTDYDIPLTGQIGAALKASLEDIRSGRKPDLYGWNYFV